MRWIFFGLLWLAVVAPGSAAEDPPMREPDAGGVSAEARFNEGRALADRRDWAGAERKYRDAITLDPSLPEPWNGLGYALRQQRRLEESERAYREALRLRPDYPLALEYLGHAYVEMGRLDDARAVLSRLRPLDPREADELAEAIARAARR
jgi:Flp pilus assembly protein TadD